MKPAVHNFFRKEYLKKKDINRGQYDQIANYVLAQTEISIAMGNKATLVYKSEVHARCSRGKNKDGNIEKEEEMRKNLAANHFSENFVGLSAIDNAPFAQQNNFLMEKEMKVYFLGL